MKAAPKTARIQYRGCEFKLTVVDHPEFDGHMLAVLEVDKPPRGLDRELYTLTMKWPAGVSGAD
jgi:hypothetical protein